ncbi:RDD family protein [Vibrio splendidus]|uniref:RDD family protein n=1 Tax=Vibrio splendidus TaxID=29497 RepID=UPI003D0E31B1
MITIRRLLAYLVDYIVIIGLFTVLSTTLGGIEKYGLWFLFHFVALVVTYFALLYRTLGYSVGEKLFKLRVHPFNDEHAGLELSGAIFRGIGMSLYTFAPILAIVALFPSKRSVADRISMTVLRVKV